MKSPQLTKLPVAEVHAFLRSNDALIVHFSGVPPGTSYQPIRHYPEDLHHVINGGAQSGVACSVVTPRDKFVGASERHALGCIGVILDLKTPNSLIAAAPQDIGSWVQDGVRQYPEMDITAQVLADSLAQRGATHNEWGVRDFKVIAVLAVQPFEIWENSAHGGPTKTTIERLMDEFDGLPLVTSAYGRWWVTGSSQNLYCS